MGRSNNFDRIKMMAFLASLALCIFGFAEAVDRMDGRQRQKGLRRLDESIRRAVMSCYATEGVYPPGIRYLRDHYGIQFNEERYVVFYEVEGTNLMPEITVMEKK